MANINEWSTELEKLIKKWKIQIEKRRKLHSEIAHKYSKRHYMYGIPASICFSFVASGQIAVFSTDVNQWVQFIMTVVSIFGTVLVSIQTFWNFSETSQNHSSASDSYDSLYRTIDTILKLPRNMRDNPTIVLKDIRSLYDDIIKSSPRLDEEIELNEIYDGNSGSDEQKNQSEIDIPVSISDNTLDSQVYKGIHFENCDKRAHLNTELKFQLERLQRQVSNSEPVAH